MMDKITFYFFLSEKLIYLYWRFKLEESNGKGCLIYLYFFSTKLSKRLYTYLEAMHKTNELKVKILV